MLKDFLLIFLACCAIADACGGFFCQQNLPVVQSGEAIAFGVTLGQSTTTVEMHIQINYQGPSEKFSWLLPVPFQPSISIGSEVMFQRLFQQTLPNFQLTINEEATTTCTQEDLGDDFCVAFGATTDKNMETTEAVVLEEGSVGPFDFTVLEAAENNPESIRTWLQNNGYDEYETSSDLLNYYATLDHKFVAVRLNKDADTGDIQPLILTYDMPPVEKIEEALVACVPIKLTAVAATANMPIYVYVLGEYRAIPTNMYEVILDDTTVDWLGCGGSQSCFISDLQARFREAVKDIDNHAFYTEFAGGADILAGQVEIAIDAAELERTQSTIEYFDLLTAANVPAIPIVHNIISKYITPLEETILSGCASEPSLYGQSPFCLQMIAPETIADPEALTAELKEKVFDPSITAQDFVDRFKYLTRLYAEMSPEHMTKDPFFSFDPDLPDVSNIRTAQGVPVCDGEGIDVAMEITVEDGSMIRVPATKICGVWRRADSSLLFGTGFSPAKAFTVHRYGKEPSYQVQRFNGTFVEEDIMTGTAQMDDRVVSQVVPEYVEMLPSETPAITSPTAAPTVASFAVLRFPFRIGFYYVCFLAGTLTID